MPSKKAKQKLIKHHISSVARIVACASFLVLTIIGVSSLVRAMTLEAIANENGIPSSWKAASLGNPETITVPITYWDQRQDDCGSANQQFEWTMCNIYASDAQQGIVRDTLGTDGLPIPVHETTASARAAGVNQLSENVTGHNPVQPGDNFYQWFHDTARSQHYDREVTFKRIGNNTYTYGGSQIFPLDDVSFSNNDSATKQGHNYHFTAHLQIAMKIAANGQERFEFSGDDDVWVFLNNKLVLDIGGLHQKLEGWFTINQDGTISTYVESAGYKTIDAGLSEGDVVNLDFFYAERSTSDSNTKITIRNMNWPISADSNLESKIVSKVGETESNLVQNIASITNRDPSHPLQLERIAAYLKEDTTITDTAGHVTNETNSGFLPLTIKTLYYTTTPNDNNSWQAIDISAPANSTSGFNLASPLIMAPAGTTGDTLYFRYFAETSEYSGTLNSQVNFFTTMNGLAGVTYDYDKVSYTSNKVDPSNDHTVTIKYLYEDNSEAAPTYQETYHKGDTYQVESPEIDGFKSDIDVISGTIENSSLEYTVYYIAEKAPVDPETPKHTVTVKYIYEDGTPAAESVIQELEEGSEYSVTSPTITNHTPDHEKIEGTVADQDIEHVVIYKKNPEPVVPEPENPVPEEPIVPETPNQPDIPGPVLPPSDIIGDDLLYLAPLGEVAFIPNTGIIGEAIASVFEESFAEIILSQGFVMMMLALFAASFATYFSLRKYLVLTPAAVKASPNTKAAKTRMKSAKRMSTKPVVAKKSAARNAHRANTKTIRKK